MDRAGLELWRVGLVCRRKPLARLSIAHLPSDLDDKTGTKIAAVLWHSPRPLKIDATTREPYSELEGFMKRQAARLTLFFFVGRFPQ